VSRSIAGFDHFRMAPDQRSRFAGLQLRLEIDTYRSYISSVDLDAFGQLSVFLIEGRAQLLTPDRCPRHGTHPGCLATRQFLE
jgi:hypothetical protein